MSENALSFALPEGRELKTLLKYEGLSLSALLVLPIIPILGYIVEVVGAAANGADEVPEFEDPVHLTKRGLGMALLLVVYLVLVSATYTATSMALPLVAGMATWMITSLFQYAYPAIFAEYAVSGSLRDIDLGRMASAMTSREYLLAVFAGIGASYGMLMLGAFIGATVIGLVLLPGFLFAGTVATACWWGRGYRAGVQA